MKWTIYIITNNSNKKKYVGLTLKTIKKRWKEHCWWAFNKPKKDKRILSCALRKYGIESFSIDEIDSAVTLHEANQKEKEWITKLKTFGSGYNMTEGGDGIVGLRGERHGMWGKGYLMSGELNPMYGKNGKQHPMFGKHHSEETKAKMCASHNHIQGDQHWSTGKPKSKVTREKLRMANLGKKQSAETIEKRVSKFTGDKHYRAKTYKVTSPDGSEYIIKSLCHFCVEHRLKVQSLWNSIRRGAAITKGSQMGWRAELIDDKGKN